MALPIAYTSANYTILVTKKISSDSAYVASVMTNNTITQFTPHINPLAEGYREYQGMYWVTIGY